MFTKNEFRDLRVAVSLRAEACEENGQLSLRGAKRWRALYAKIQRAEQDQARKMDQMRARARAAAALSRDDASDYRNFAEMNASDGKGSK